MKKIETLKHVETVQPVAVKSRCPQLVRWLLIQNNAPAGVFHPDSFERDISGTARGRYLGVTITPANSGTPRAVIWEVEGADFSGVATAKLLAPRGGSVYPFNTCDFNVKVFRHYSEKQFLERPETIDKSKWDTYWPANTIPHYPLFVETANIALREWIRIKGEV